MSHNGTWLSTDARSERPGTSRLARLVSHFGIDPYILLVAVVALFPIAPLLQPGYFWDAHDARHSVYFIFEMDRGIQDGILYPRWQPDFAFGYGYPFFNIYGPLSSFAGEAFHLLGVGFTDSVKIVFGLSILASGLAMYGFVKRVAGRQAGLVAAVAYMVIPYRLVDLYVRAALAEAVAYVFVPLVLWGAWAAIRRPRLTNILGLALAYAALTVTHPLTALLLTVILICYVAVLALEKVNEQQPLRRLSRESLLPLVGHLGHVVIPVVAGLALGLGLSAFFILPAMTETRFVRVDQWVGGRYAWGGDFVEFFQLSSPRWGWGVSVPGPDDSLSFQLGAVPLVLSLFGVLSLWWRSSPHARGEREPSAFTPEEIGSCLPSPQPSNPRGEGAGGMTAFFAGLTAVAILLMLGVSAPVWQALPLVRLVQFPWRLLSVTVVSMAFLCGAVLSKARDPGQLPGYAALVLVALLVLGSLPYMQAVMSEGDVSMAGLIKFQQSSDEMTGSTAWVTTIPRWSSMADSYIAGKPVTSKINYDLFYPQPRAKARTLELHTQSELIEYSLKRSGQITFDTFYYPGWRAYLLDAKTNAVLRELPITQHGELGLMTVQVPAGLGRVLLRFEDTPVRKLGWALSAVSLGLVAMLALFRWALRRGI